MLEENKPAEQPVEEQKKEEKPTEPQVEVKATQAQPTIAPVEEAPPIKTPTVVTSLAESTTVEAPLVENPSDISPVDEATVAKTTEAHTPVAETPVTEAQPEATTEVKEEKPIEEPRIEGAVNKGDFIQIEMTGKVAETGAVFETTNEETARESGIHKEDRVYGPRLVIAGEGWVLRGLDNKLKGIKPGEQTSIEIPPEEAFGERDPNNIQLVPYRVLRSKGVNPIIGAEIEIEGRSAVIRNVTSGRVQVDYNHPLAGRKINYTVNVAKIIEDENEKINALIGRRFVGVDSTKFTTTISEKTMTVNIPDEVFFGENIQIAKRGLAMDLLKYWPKIDEVKFQEIVKRT